MHALGPERLRRERGRERRVDPARDADDDVAEAVLLDVVPQAELEREPHLLELVEERRDGGRGRASVERRARGAARSQRPATSGAPRRSRASARRRTSRSRRPITTVGSTSTTSSASSNPGARASTSPSSSITTEWPSKISSSWPPTAFTNAMKHELSRARWTSICSRSRSLPTWNGDAEMFAISSAPASARSVAGGPGLPDVLADRRPDERAAELEQEQVAARREVAVLVEDAVVGQEALAVDRLHLAVGADAQPFARSPS